MANKSFGHDFFDFGFTMTDVDELDVLKEKEQQVKQATASKGEMQDRLDNVYNAIQPLLNNLKKDPEKSYILWENRLPKIEAFEEHLKDLYLGNK